MNESEKDLALQGSTAQRKRKTIQKERGNEEEERETETEREKERKRERKSQSNVIKEMHYQEGAHTGSSGETLTLKGFWGGFSTGLSQGGYARSLCPTPLFQ